MIALKTVDLSWYQILDYFYNIESIDKDYDSDK